MYERFTDRARKVMQLAQQEAARLNHEYVGTEHVLLGLVAEGAGVAANVLANLGADFDRVRREVERFSPPGPDILVCSRLPHAPRTQEVIESAEEEARALYHNYVGTEHLLLGLLRASEGGAAKVLTALGLKLDDVREEVLSLLGYDMPTGPVEVVHLARSLNPEKTEPYPVAAYKPRPLSQDNLAALRALVERLNGQKEEAVLAEDFERAAGLRDEAEVLRELIAWYEWSRNQP